MFSGVFSDDVEGWRNALLKALKTQKPNKLRDTDDTLDVNIKIFLSLLFSLNLYTLVYIYIYKLPVKGLDTPTILYFYISYI